MTDDSSDQITSTFGALLAVISAVLSLALIVALFNFRTGYPGTILVALVVCSSLAFWLLDGPAIWRAINQERADEATVEANTRTALAVIEADRAARRNAVTVWPVPERHLFAAPDDRSLDWDYNDPDPDIALRGTLTAAEADELFALFVADPRLNWMVGLAHCEARADLMAEIAAERGIRLGKLWALASDLDRGTAVSGFDGRVTIHINAARTESTAWNFHVAPCGSTVDAAGDPVRTVIDPMLFDKPIVDTAWRARLRERGDEINFEVTDRFVSEDPFDVNGRQFRTLKVQVRNEFLETSYDLDNAQTVAALAMTLRGQYVDELMTASPHDYEEFMRRFEDGHFREWWRSSADHKELDEQLDEATYFGLPMADIKRTIRSVSWELREHTIKTTHWKEVALNRAPP